jgi:TM2 domain-containing membrane protein YozV
MDEQQKTMLRYENAKKSIGVAYVLWIIAAVFGAHRFYMKRVSSAVVMLILSIIALPLVVFIGPAGFIITMLWAIVDAFLIPGWIRDYNNKLLETI